MPHRTLQSGRERTLLRESKVIVDCQPIFLNDGETWVLEDWQSGTIFYCERSMGMKAWQVRGDDRFFRRSEPSRPCQKN